MPEAEDHGHRNFACNDLWSRNLVINKKQENKLAVAQRSMERSTLNITKRDCIRNEEVRRRTGVEDILERTHSMKGRWEGLLARMDKTRWTKIATEWTPRQGKRRKVRPGKRWGDSKEETRGPTWMQIAQDWMWRLPGVRCEGYLPAVA